VKRRDPNANAAAPRAIRPGTPWWVNQNFIQVVAVITVAFVVLGLARYWPDWALQAEVRRFRGAGLPVTLEELNAWYPRPTGTNAADVYLRAFEAYVRDEAVEQQLAGMIDPREILPPRGEPLPPVMVQLTETYVARNADALRLLREAASIEGCRFPVDFTEPGGLKHLQNLRHAAYLLRLETGLRTHRGQTEAALESVAVMLRLGDSLKGEPTFVSQATRHSLDAGACKTLEWVIADRTFTDRSLSAFSVPLVNKDCHEDMVRAVAGDQCSLLIGGERWHFIDNDMEKGLKTSGLGSVIVLLSMQATFTFIEANQGLTAPNPDWDDGTDGRWLRNLRLVPLDIAARLILTQGERLDVTRLGLAVKRHELANGQLPDQLEDLVPDYLDAVPVSPFDGKPLRCRATETGLVVYGPGRDGRDDGGVESRMDGQRHLSDTTFEVDRLAARPTPAGKEMR